MKTFTFTNSVIRVGHNFIYGLLLIILFQSSAMAQFSSLKNGDRVRVIAPDIQSEAIAGTIYGINSTDIFLDSEGNSFIIPLNSIEQLDISEGFKRRTGIGTLSGLVGGTLVGGIIGASNFEPCDEQGFFACWGEPKNRRQAFGRGALIGGITGAILGAVAGYSTKMDRWERIPIETTFRFPMDPSHPLAMRAVVKIKFSTSKN